METVAGKRVGSPMAFNKSVKSPGKRKYTSCGKGRRKLDFCPEKKMPLQGKTLFLDVQNHTMAAELRKRIEILGGRVDEFFSKEISLVITSQRCFDKMDSGQSPCPHSTGRSPLQQPAESGWNSIPSNVSRGKDVLSRVYLSRLSETPDVAAKARKLGVQLITVEDFMDKYIRKSGESKEGNIASLKAQKNHSSVRKSSTQQTVPQVQGNETMVSTTMESPCYSKETPPQTSRQTEHPCHSQGSLPQPTQNTNKDQERLLDPQILGVHGLCECPICFEKMVNPKSLQCDHSFCKDCIEEIAEFDAGKPSIKCPMCNIVHVMKKGTTVDALKTSLLLKQLLDVLEKSREVSDPAEGSLPCSCNKSVTSYCGDCNVYQCSQCMSTHPMKGCKNFMTVQYSRSKGAIMPYCGKHNSLKYYGCITCTDAVCPYCREMDHKNHKSVPLNEYSNIFGGYVTSKLQDYEKYRDALQNIMSNPSNQSSNVAQVISQRKLVMLSKCMYILEVMEKEMSEATKQSQQIGGQVDGNILSNRAKWTEKLNACHKAIEYGNNLAGKGNVEIIGQTKTILEITTGDVSNIGNGSLYLKDDGELVDRYLFHHFRSSFGRLVVPCMDDAGIINMSTLDPNRTNIANITDLSKLNNVVAAKQFVEERIQQFL